MLQQKQHRKPWKSLRKEIDRLKEHVSRLKERVGMFIEITLAFNSPINYWKWF